MTAVGKIGGLYGARGEVSLVLYDAFPADVNMEEPVFVGIDEHRVPLFFATFVRRGQRGATATFDDIDTEARAVELVGLELLLKGANDAEDENSANDGADFVGWLAEIGDKKPIEITDFLDGANPLFELADGTLLPAALAVKLDKKSRTLTFDLPEGLLDLNN